MKNAEIHRKIDAIWKIESARILTGLTRMVQDVGLAEDLAQDALVIALEKWPKTGVPDNPGAWLTAVAKRRAIDLFRRDRRREEKYRQLGQETDYWQELDWDAMDSNVGDDLLRLIFTTCHAISLCM
ncbi:sigma factor [Siminovitchia fortis]|uniref:sigma factor n=1 Tax=Siminovitchia fortis TaxID=254758 RepID=UPI0011AB09B1|nr:sigma factor [Siminovitchia fortis]